MALRWMGRAAKTVQVPFAELRPMLPTFSVQPFTLPTGADNPDMRVLTTTISGSEVPVVAVDATYGLFQHTDLYDILAEGLGDVEPGMADVTLTRLGERLEIGVALPFEADPGDGHPVRLRLMAHNSVDRSLAVRLSFEWLRLVCINGMVVAEHLLGARRLHSGGLTPERVRVGVTEALGNAPGAFERVARWVETPVTADGVEQWLEQTVAARWGRAAAVRVYHVFADGVDGRVLPGRRPAECTRLWEEPWEARATVPGGAPGSMTAWNAAQALSWVGSRSTSVGERTLRVATIPALVDRLVTRN